MKKIFLLIILTSAINTSTHATDDAQDAGCCSRLADCIKGLFKSNKVTDIPFSPVSPTEHYPAPIAGAGSGYATATTEAPVSYARLPEMFRPYTTMKNDFEEEYPIFNTAGILYTIYRAENPTASSCYEKYTLRMSPKVENPTLRKRFIIKANAQTLDIDRSPILSGQIATWLTNINILVFVNNVIHGIEERINTGRSISVTIHITQDVYRQAYYEVYQDHETQHLVGQTPRGTETKKINLAYLLLINLISYESCLPLLTKRTRAGEEQISKQLHITYFDE